MHPALVWLGEEIGGDIIHRIIDKLTGSGADVEAARQEIRQLADLVAAKDAQTAVNLRELSNQLTYQLDRKMDRAAAEALIDKTVTEKFAALAKKVKDLSGTVDNVSRAANQTEAQLREIRASGEEYKKVWMKAPLAPPTSVLIRDVAGQDIAHPLFAPYLQLLIRSEKNRQAIAYYRHDNNAMPPQLLNEEKAVLAATLALHQKIVAELVQGQKALEAMPLSTQSESLRRAAAHKALEPLYLLAALSRPTLEAANQGRLAAPLYLLSDQCSSFVAAIDSLPRAQKPAPEDLALLVQGLLGLEYPPSTAPGDTPAAVAALSEQANTLFQSAGKVLQEYRGLDAWRKRGRTEQNKEYLARKDALNLRLTQLHREAKTCLSNKAIPAYLDSALEYDPKARPLRQFLRSVLQPLHQIVLATTLAEDTGLIEYAWGHFCAGADKLFPPPKPIVLTLGQGLEISFLPIPAGPFTMGKPEQSDQIEVKLSRNYWMAETETTQAQWRAVMGTTLKQQKAKENTYGDITGEGDEQPMYFVSHDEAMEFCEKLNKLSAAQLPAGHKVALPTEAQWEYAARAGDSTRIFGVGDGQSLGKADANFAWKRPYGKAAKASASSDGTMAVKSFPPNAWGLHDMHGNVLEWCLDSRDGSTKLPGGTDPLDVSGPSFRVIRGGSWDYGADGCAACCRSRGARDSRFYYLGFRLALSPASPGR